MSLYLLQEEQDAEERVKAKLLGKITINTIPSMICQEVVSPLWLSDDLNLRG